MLVYKLRMAGKMLQYLTPADAFQDLKSKARLRTRITYSPQIPGTIYPLHRLLDTFPALLEHFQPKHRNQRDTGAQQEASPRGFQPHALHWSLLSPSANTFISLTKPQMCIFKAPYFKHSQLHWTLCSLPTQAPAWMLTGLPSNSQLCLHR